MKKLIILSLVLFSGCFSNKCTNEECLVVNCKKAPKTWWGEAGENPSENDLWKCYGWILTRKNDI